ncbi:MAG: hypothetical protein HY673_05760 [Chloroflexi bacterium]|nr:hypothetical protein [Chloroflexota bacterium]
MNWFKRHINWTYLLSMVFSILLALLVGLISGFVDAVANKSDPLYGLHAYLDERYTRLWSATDVPDFDKLSWTSPGSSGWQHARFTAYLENKGNLTIEVRILTSNDPRFVQPGFSASSDAITLRPGERRPITINMSRDAADQATLIPERVWDVIYYEVQPILGETSVLAYWLTVMPLLAGSAAWVLHQEGRSYAWLLPSLSGIGMIIILCLANKRQPRSESEAKELSANANSY